MPRPRNPNRDRAKQIWFDHEGKITNRQLADLIGENEKVVAVWKQRDVWSKEVQQTDESCTTNARKRSGAPKGNRNAVGNIGGTGGPPGNKKAVTTGEHEAIGWDMLDDDERVIYTTINTDELVAIDRTIRMMEIRERRMLKRIKELQDGANMVMSSAVETNQTSKQFGDSDGRTTTLESAVDRIQRIEEALTRVQEKKGKYIELRSKLIPPEMRAEMEKLRIEKMRAEVAKLQGIKEETDEDDGFLDALNGMVPEVWDDENEGE